MFDTTWSARALLVPAALLAFSLPLAAQGPTVGSGIPIRKDATRPIPARDTSGVVTGTSTGSVAGTRRDTSATDTTRAGASALAPNATVTVGGDTTAAMTTGTDSTTVDTTGAPMSMSAPGPDVASWTDANILAHLRTGDSLEVQTAQLALQQSQNPQVQSLARTLIDDHTRNMRAADSLARALRITPQPAANDTSAQHMMHEMTSWQGVTGMQFDRSWTQFQADHHRMDVQSLPKLRQQSQNPALQTFIDNTLPVIRMHVDRVQTVQQQVASGT